MNPKQLACVVLMMCIGAVTYFGQIMHNKVTAMKASAKQASEDARTAEDARQVSEILVTKVRAETEDLRRFLKAWMPYADRVQTEQEVDSAFELSLRDRGITLVRSRKSEVKARRDDKFMPKIVQTSIIVEDDYAKVMNWLGDIEKRLPLARVTTCTVTGGSSVRQAKLDVTIETPIIDMTAGSTSGATSKK
ncbi:MAG: hypothetical protein LDL31_03740 [Prosthecobacter sp.]|nr:hypothetical protein [Prosthecobacter sp.]